MQGVENIKNTPDKATGYPMKHDLKAVIELLINFDIQSLTYFYRQGVPRNNLQ